LDKWVETQQIISEEKADWRTERSILSDTVTLLSNEIERLDKALEDLEASATAADEDRSELAAEKETLAEAVSVVETNIAGLENQLKRVLPALPAPLVDTIKPLIRRLPDDSNDTQLSIGERVQNIVGILSQADKFNTTLTATSESLELDSGKVVEVRTLYWGLAMAYYVDASGEYAGIGFPGADGWEWPQIEGKGPEINRLLDIYEGSGEIQFVEVPARIN
jgi:chromosome segregation ATPase